MKNPEDGAESRYRIWILEFMQNCLRELPGSKSAVDMNLAMSMCHAEPQCAQVAMQALADRLERLLDGKDVSEATGKAETYRLLLVSLLIAYELFRGIVDGIPLEIKRIVEKHPVILDCEQFVINDQQK